MANKTVTLNKIIDEFKLEVISLNKDINNILICSPEINRPGLQLAGFLEHFNSERIQVIGRVEMAYLESMNEKERTKRLRILFGLGFPCVIIANNLKIYDDMVELSKEYNIPILRSNEITSILIASLTRFLNLELAPSLIVKGVFMEIWGEGVLIMGEAGIGKSEMALELIKQNHRLIADEDVEIRKVSDKTLVAQSPKYSEHLLKVSGLDVINVREVYGAGTIKSKDSIDLVIEFEKWDQEKFYDRIGLDELYKDIMGIKVPMLVVPVKPGRNLSVIVGTAAINNRLKKFGYNSALEFVTQIDNNMRCKSE